MIHYMVGKHTPNSSHLSRRLVKYVSGRGCFRTVPSQNGDKIVTSPPPIVERVQSSAQEEKRQENKSSLNRRSGRERAHVTRWVETTSRTHLFLETRTKIAPGPHLFFKYIDFTSIFLVFVFTHR